MRRAALGDAVGCAAVADAVGEPLAGTAPPQRRMLCVEVTSPWPHGAAAELLPAEVGRRCEELGIRVQLIRRTQRPAPPSRAAGLLVWADRDDRRAERVLLEHPDAVADLDLERFTAPASAGLGEPVTDAVWLVCTHGSKDPCCALRGLPLVRALRAAGCDVWQTSHTGGDRFAANAFVLPEGIAFGRVEAARAQEIAMGARPAEMLRGRLGLSRAEQAAEVLGGAPAERCEPGEQGTRVWLRDGRQVVVECVPLGRPRPITCRRPDERADPGAWRLRPG